MNTRRPITHPSPALGRSLLAGLLTTVALGTFAPPARAQEVRPSDRIHVATGSSAVVTVPAPLQRISIANPAVADAVPVSTREIVINGKAPGSTSLILWDAGGNRAMYSIRVTPNAASLQRDLARLFPEEDFVVEASGGTLILSGDVREAAHAKQALQVARASLGDGVEIIDDLTVPRPDQVMLEIRFAEVSRNALEQIGLEFLEAGAENFDLTYGTSGVVQPAGDQIGDREITSGPTNLFLFHRPSNVAAFINALKSNGIFKSLAEPNLLAMDGDSASFLAGGEFPFPVLQGQSGSVTIQFKEFGIRLSFVPNITPSGSIRLDVAPEVSSLDFANGLQISGFQIPALLTRRANTTIELRDGQTFAIAGLMDHTLTETVNKIPVLGDIPVLGALFRSEEMRQNRSELLVLVTPHLVRPSDTSPPVPTGEPETWQWDKYMKQPIDPDASTSMGGAR